MVSSFNSLFLIVGAYAAFDLVRTLALAAIAPGGAR